MINDAMLEFAQDELEAILSSPDVGRRLTEFAQNRRYPWEGATERRPTDDGMRAKEVRQ
jgi:hypothetical protein